MTAAYVIRKRITDQGPDSLWAFDDFSSLPQYAVAKALSRFTMEGLIQRVRKGLYYYPKQTALGPSHPGTSALLAKTFKKSKGMAVYSGGTASFQNLGITSQIPAQYTLLSDMVSRKMSIGSLTVRIQRRSLAHLGGATQEDIWILDSVRNLKHVPDSTPADAVAKIVNRLQDLMRSSGRSKGASQGTTVKRLLRFAQGEPPRVRAVLGAIAERIGYHGPEGGALKNSLNPLTKFHLGIKSVLPNTQSWNIV